MPKDVVLGEGHIGDALLAAFPGQYGAQDTEARVKNPSLEGQDTAYSGLPTYLPGYQGVRATDPDHGRQFVLQDMPGVGQVVVPVEHTIAAVYPASHDMAGTQEEELGIIVSDDLSGLGATQKIQHGMGRLAEVAGRAAHRAVALSRSGQLRSMGEVEAYVTKQVQDARGLVERKLQAKIGKLSSVAAHATKQAMAAIRSEVAKLFGPMKPTTTRIGGMGSLGKSDVAEVASLAGKAARRAVEMAREGQLQSADAARAYVASAVSDALQAVNSKVAATVKDKAVAHALSLVRADLDLIFGSQAVDLVIDPLYVMPIPGYWGRGGGRGPRRHHGGGGGRHRGGRGGGGRRGMRGIDDWYGSMMGVGGLTESLVNVASGQELDDLNRAVSKLHDALIASYGKLDELEKQRAAATGLRASVGGGPASEEVFKAERAVKEGYNALTGFDYMTQVLAQVFTPAAAQFRKVYSGIDGFLTAVKNWNDTWTRRVQPVNGQLALWDSIQDRHRALYAEAKGGTMDPNDPVFVTTAQKAVEDVLGYQAQQLAEAGMSDFGLTALIGTIVVTVGLIALSMAAVKLAREFNVVANNMHQQRVTYEAQSAKEREQYIAQRAREGVSVAQAAEEWVGVKAKADAAQATKEATYAKTAPSALDLGKYLAPAAGVAAAILILPKILGIG